MAPQKIQQSQNTLHVIPSSAKKSEASQQPQKADDDELTEEDLECLHVLENDFLNSKDKTKDCKRKESKKQKRSRSTPGEPQGSPKLEASQVNTSSDFSVKNSSSKRKKLEFVNGLTSQKDNQPDKKVRKKKKPYKVHFESSGSPLQCKDVENVRLFSGSSVKSSTSKKKDKRSALEEDVENILPQENGKSDKIPDSSSVKVKKSKKKNQDVSIDSLLPNDCSQPVPEIRTSRKKTQRCQETELLSSSLSSPDNLPKAFLEDKHGADDANNISDHSQDLFLTQKHILPSGLSTCSEDSPPLGQEQQDATRVEQSGSQGSSCGLRPLSHSSLKSQYSSGEMKALGTIRKDKSTQTDNLFTYLSLMAFLKRVKGLEACSEKPLDLSLNCRARAVGSRGRLASDDEVIIIGSSPVVTTSGKPIERRIILSPPQPFDNSKLVQTILNSSYYFRGKGEKGELNPFTPLLKVKEEPMKKRKKSIRS